MMYLPLLLLLSSWVVLEAHLNGHSPTMFDIVREIRYPIVSPSLVNKAIQHFLTKYGEFIPPDFATEMKELQKPENEAEIDDITKLWELAIERKITPPREPKAALRFYTEELPLSKDRIARVSQNFEAKYNGLDAEAQQFLNEMDDKLHEIDDITDQTTMALNMFHIIVEGDRKLQSLSEEAKTSLSGAWPEPWKFIESDKYKKRMEALSKLEGKPIDELIDGLSMLFIRYTIEDEYGIETDDFDKK